ncbi:unnamed protein product [Notodromas monacha]|uniref:Ribosomal protein L7Ae/L30e/S12e/Gadd45 domain-containing protein n=1 Tax=Notodromas monacha TaxID=399045 RepID=A0A7R9BLK4_9CRUS|nr:unnamed protein product [Notodromas monacha]CAG0916407.1 unnamed protein product [Notodromas monacha]
MRFANSSSCEENILSLHCSAQHIEEEMNVKEMWKLRPALNQVLERAATQGRLTYGLHACLKVLQICPQSVLVCILPVDAKSPQQNCEDKSKGILHRLLEAFCFENDIKLLKIEPASSNTGQPMPRLDREGTGSHPLDVGCILIHWASNKDDLSEDDRHFLRLYSIVSHSCQSPWPCLPVDTR